MLLPGNHHPAACSRPEFCYADDHCYDHIHIYFYLHSNNYTDPISYLDHHLNNHTFAYPPANSYPYVHTHLDFYAYIHFHTKPNADTNSNLHRYAYFHIYRHTCPTLTHRHPADPLILPANTQFQMTDITPFLKELLTAPGLSGYEDSVAEIIFSKWTPLVDTINRGKLGSLHGFRHGTGKSPRPSVMVAAHMDAIGLMVTGIVDGFLRLTDVGGVDPRVLPGTLVTVYASGAQGHPPIPGLVVQPSIRLLPPELGLNPVPLEYLFVDTGLSPSKVEQLVRVGDTVSFAQPPVELSGETIAGHSLDNRASVAALTICLEELQTRPHIWDVWAVATTQEEGGMKGAIGSTFELHPTIAIALDVTFAKGPGASDWQTVPFGKGPTLCTGPNIHPAMHKAMLDLAERLEIPYGLEYTPRHTGTDGFATQVAAEGVPTLVVGIPLRYMHTPVELVAIKDIQRAGRLLAEFIAGLPVDFMEKITWDD